MRNSNPPSNFTSRQVLRGRFDGWILLSENYCNVKNTIFPDQKYFRFSRENHQLEFCPKPSEIHQKMHQMPFLNVKIRFLLFWWSHIFWFFYPDQKFQIFLKCSEFLIWEVPVVDRSKKKSLKIKSIIIARLSWKFGRLTQRFGVSDGS